MKLGRLEIHNIASIGDAVIDFRAEPLAAADVFLISGATGSGKSTILDCICLALYGSVPRMGSGRGSEQFDDVSFNDQRQLLRAGTGEGYARLTFTGNDGLDYEASWYVRRSYNRPDRKLQKIERTLVIDGDTKSALDKVKEIDARIMVAVGVDYRQFVRTSLLAQGEFTRFLKADDKEKSEILEKLTGTSHFKAIGAEIYRRTSALKSKADDLMRRAGEGGSMSGEDEIAVLRQGLDTLVKETEKASASKAVDDAALRWHIQHERLKAATEAAKTSLEAARAHSRSEAVEKARTLVADIKATANAREALREREKADSDIRRLDGEKASLASQWADADRALTGLRQQIHNAGQALILCRNLSQKDITVTPSSYRSIMALIDRIGIDSNEVLSAEFDRYVIESADCREKQVVGDMSVLSSRLEAQRRKADSLKDVRRELQNIAAMEERLRAERKAEEDSAASLKELRLRMPGVKELAETLTEVWKESDRLFASVDMTRKEWACKARATLTEGCTCPVCMQRVDLLPQASGIPEEQWSAFRDRRDNDRRKAEEARSKYLAMQASERSMQESLSRLAASNASLAKDISDIKLRAKARLEAVCPQREMTVTAIDEAINDTEKEIAATSRLMAKASIAAALDEKQRSLAADLERLRNSSASAEGYKASILDMCPHWERTEGGASGGDAPSMLIRVCERLRAITEQGSAVALRRKAAETVLTDFIASNPHYTLDRIIALASTTEREADTALSTVKAADDACMRGEAILDGCMKQQEENERQKPAAAEGCDRSAVEERISAAASHIAQLNSESGALLQKIKAAEEAAAKYKAIIEEYNRTREEWMRWKRLDDLIGSANGDMFNRIAQSFVLGSLLDHANTYLSRLTSRYRLCGKPGTYLILLEDAYNGYRRRPVVTSSGGESFMVSLALALALADAGTSFSCDTLFVDEGFGSLSGEPLRKAVAMLRSLNRSSGRRVGIISHIESLKTEIPVQIRVGASAAGAGSAVSTVDMSR